MTTEDEWTTVTKSSKRCANRKKNHRHKNSKISADISSSFSLEAMDESFHECSIALAKSQFFLVLKDILQSLPTTITQIICYGIGNFGNSSGKAPMWQLALACAIRDLLPSSTPVFYFDPCMTTKENIFLERQAIKSIQTNERGKRLIQSTTLFFMPHCPLKLYSNVLHENWQHLPYCIIFGNCLTSYTNQLWENEKPGVKALKTLKAYWEEILLAITKQDMSDMPAFFFQAFNDSSLTHFTRTTGSNDKEEVTWPDRPVEIDHDDDGGETI